MRVGLVTDFYFPWIGGPATVIRNLGHGLAERGHSVALLAPSIERSASQEWDGHMLVSRVGTVPVPFGYHMRSPLLPLPYVRRWLQVTQPDVIHIHHPFPISATALGLARRRSLPVVATNHTVPECSLWGLQGHQIAYRVADRALSAYIVKFLQSADRVATPTETAASALRLLGYRGEIHCISNGIDTEHFKPKPASNDLKDRLGLDDRPVVLYTGRLDAEKQMDVWLRAADIVRRNSDVQFVVGGNGSDRPRLEELSHELKLDTHVTFIGYVSDDDFPLLYNLADVYFVTSPVELQSIATLEAISSGLPVVAARAGALPELVGEGENGMLFTPGNINEAAEALATLVHSAPTRTQYGQRSREVARGHELERTVDAYESLLMDAVRRGQ